MGEYDSDDKLFFQDRTIFVTLSPFTSRLIFHNSNQCRCSSFSSTVVLHERGPLFRILGPPKQQVSNIFKKFQSAGRSLLMMHENLHFSKQILHNFFQNFLFSIPWKIHEKPLSFCQPFYWPWIFNLHFSLEPGIVEACNMAHLNPVSLKINLVGWNPPFMPLSWSKCEKTEFFQYFSRRWARCFRLEMSLENMF